MPDAIAQDDLAHVKAGLGSDLDTVLVHNLLRTTSCLSPFIDADLRRQNLTASQLNMLLMLRAAGPGGLLMGEIGQLLVVAKSNVTGLVDRLEEQKLVIRADCNDRRATTVRLTEAGLALLRKLAPRHAQSLSRLTQCLSGPEKKTLIRLLTRLRRQLRLSAEGR